MNSSELITRRIVERDRLGVHSLCLASFPIEYPESWYDDVVSGVLTSIGIFSNDNIVALIVAEHKLVSQCNVEDRDILSDELSSVVYILSLAVASEYRRKGLATRLLEYLRDMYSSPNRNESFALPHALFLHVLSTNHSAISFYKRHGFVLHDTLLNYYRLKDGFGDGLTFVLYINGGHRSYTFLDICRMCASFLCSPLKRLMKSDNESYRD